MEKQVKSVKSEKILLGLTTVFLCVLLGLFWRDWQRDQEAELVVSTEFQVPQEEIVPEIVVLNLNTATLEELKSLPGIGEELARRILEYRRANGPFETVQEILEVSGIGEKKLAGLQGRLAVE